MSGKNLDWLADTVLLELQNESASLDTTWVEDKRASLSGLDRLSVLRWIVTAPDDENQNIAARVLGVSSSDLLAVQRVLTKI